MCGISGFIGLKDYFPKKDKVKALLKSMERRGPDGKGIFINKLEKQSVIFLHTRLSIIDLQKKSNQPFEDENGVLSFNGEIYNYLELREFCLQQGIKFKTFSDTEVLLKMLNLYGEKVFEYLDGMWSFSYYNKHSKKIILARDRFGEKPLYYLKDPSYLVFGSNITYLKFLSKSKLNFDMNKISDFLLLGFKSLGLNQNTIFKHVKSLRPGSVMVINLNEGLKINIKRYWSGKFNSNFKHSYQEAVGILASKISNSFSLRFRSDVPLTSLLSGGMDSSSIMSVAKRKNINLKCYSIKSSLKDYNEEGAIKTNIKFSEFEHEFVKIHKENNFKTLKKIVEYQSYPLSSPQAFAVGIICKKIKSQGYKVMISGTGGDEFFASYYHHYLGYLYSIRESKNFKSIHDFWKKNIAKYIRSGGMKSFKNFRKNIENRLSSTSHSQHEDLELKKYVKKTINLQTTKSHDKDFFFNMLMQDIRQNSLPHQLDMLDSVPMFYSIEGRSPFLSHKIFDFVSTLPKDYFFNKGRPKALLRDAMRDYLPQSILNNFNKVGFYISYKEIFSKADRKKLKKIILNSNLLKKLLNMNEVKILLDKDNIKHSESKFLFSAVNIAILGGAYDKSY